MHHMGTHTTSIHFSCISKRPTVCFQKNGEKIMLEKYMYMADLDIHDNKLSIYVADLDIQ
jgi:hypothetical protein